MNMELNLKVKRVTILVNTGDVDRISLVLDHPTTFPEMGYETYVKLETREGYAIEWLKENFPQLSDHIEVIDMRPGEARTERGRSSPKKKGKTWGDALADGSLGKALREGRSTEESRKHYYVVGSHTNEVIGCTWGDDGKASVLEEEPEATFREVDSNECDVCAPRMVDVVRRNRSTP